MLQPKTLQFLRDVEENNHKQWFDAHKDQYRAALDDVKGLVSQIQEQLNEQDVIEKSHMYRIYRDVRFSKDKTPYKNYFSGYLSRAGLERRGGYYFSFQPGNKTMIGGGFYGPEKEDLLRIRKEFEQDAHKIKAIVTAPKFANTYGTLMGDAVKTAPKGFSKDHPNIEFIRMKQFYAIKNFSDEAVTSPDFVEKAVESYLVLLPFFDYMSEVLTTDLNGESII